MKGRILAAALLFGVSGAWAQERQQDRSSSTRDTEHGKNDDETATGTRPAQSGDTGPLRPGFELGPADALGGGRTDKGPKGATGLPDNHTSAGQSRRDSNQWRHEAIERDALPQRADVDGAGDPKHDINYAEPLPDDIKRIPGEHAKDQPEAKTEQPGGAAAQGIAGHAGSSSSASGPAPAPEGRSK